MLTNEVRREILNRVRASGFPGGISEAFRAAEQGVDVISQFEEQQSQQQGIQVANTQQQQETGLREEHAQGNTQASMAFPDVKPNQSFNTVGMKAPIDIQKVNDQGHLVESYKNVPPGIQDLPTGPHEGTVIESPAAYQKGGVKEEFPGLLPEVEVSALKDKSYNKLSDSQKQVYDSFVTPGGTAQTVNIGGDREMHWKNALQMVKDIDVNISNVPRKNIFGYDKQKVKKEGSNKGYFRPHTSMGSKTINVPAHQVYKDQMAFFQEGAKKRGLEYPQMSDTDVENLSRKKYFDNIIAETAHIPEFYRKESFKNIPITMAKRVYRSITGNNDRLSNYKDPHDLEYHTHTGPDSFEEKLRSKYEIKQKGGFNMEPITSVSDNTRVNQYNPNLEVSTTPDPTLLERITNPIRKNIAENLYPASYTNPGKRLWDAATGKKSPMFTPILNESNHGHNPDTDRVRERVDLLHLTMGQDQKYNTVKKSEYKPTNAKDTNVQYYTSPQTEIRLKKYMALNKGNRSNRPNFGSPTLGEFIIDSGEDEKGTYVSYYDKWDLNPLDHYGNKKINKFVDRLTKAVGVTPPEIYNRIYNKDLEAPLKANKSFEKTKTSKHQTGGVKETPVQYNARIKTEYEAKMQPYNDSTASYQNQVEIDNIQTDLEDEVTEYDTGLIAANDTMTSAEYEGLTDRHNKQMDKGDKTIDEVFELHNENVERGIYNPKGIEWRGERNPEDLRPTKPREPMEMITPIGMKTIDMGQTSVPVPIKARPYELVKNKSNYYTTERVGVGTHTYPKGDDNKALVRLKDEAGRTIFTGSQTEYTQKYGNSLERGTTNTVKGNKKNRLYLKQKGGFNPAHVNPIPYNPIESKLDEQFPLRNTPFPQGRIEKGAPWELKKGVRAVESSNGVNMINTSPNSTATGYYGQLYSEIKDMPLMNDISRQEFSTDTILQNKVFDKRWKGDLPNIPGLKSNIKKLRTDYKKETSNFTDNELAALSNFTGRERARQYFASLRAGTEFKMPGEEEGNNKSIPEYMKTYREALKKKKRGGYRAKHIL